MQAYLKKHGPNFSNHSIKVNWTKNDHQLTIEFLVQKRTGAPWQVDSSFSKDWLKNWGLWNKDVFEAFIQLRSNNSDFKAPYLELQVSPLNQPFALIITEPRQTFFPPKTLDLITEVSLTEKTWNGKLELTFPDELKGDLLYGGFFSCLASNEREFYALSPNPEMNPDFHRPELFLPLDQ
jgi:hypothetical protein